MDNRHGAKAEQCSKSSGFASRLIIAVPLLSPLIAKMEHLNCFFFWNQSEILWYPDRFMAIQASLSKELLTSIHSSYCYSNNSTFI